MKVPEWKRRVLDSINLPAELPPDFLLTEEERTFFEKASEEKKAGFLVTGYYCNLARSDPEDPIRKQFIPVAAELERKPYESSDPLRESAYSPMPRLVHRYRDRVLILVTGTCAVYCRHCFRRYFIGSAQAVIAEDELHAITQYVAGHPEVREVILSGGDPLILEDGEIEEILRRLSITRQDLRFRIATRTPVVLPSRITSSLLVILRRFAPLWLVTQYNHPVELTEESCRSLAGLIDIGIPVINQSVLLKGVNDSAELLEELFQKLVDNRVKPYYLFQGDLAEGTGHFRVPISRGLELMRSLEKRISGLALPTYAVDLPHGGGKIELTEATVLSRNNGRYTLKSRFGDIYHYPDEA